MSAFSEGFLWGASTSPHQTEGNNVNSDWWKQEQQSPGMQLSGDAVDSYHRYEEDMQLLADAGLNSYRFGIEWARIEPIPGHISRAELAHYRRMIVTARRLGLEPIITLHHFSNPRWFSEEGGWAGDRAVDRFTAYVEAACTILHDVNWVCTINEPNMLAVIVSMMNAYQSLADHDWQSPTVSYDIPAFPDPDPIASRNLIAAHHAARNIVRRLTPAKVGWSIANEALTSAPEHESSLRKVLGAREDRFLIAAKDDDFIGVQSYTSQVVDENGIVSHPPHPDNTMVGTAYRPDAIGIAIRHASEVTEGVPVLVTENGIATPEDQRRIAYIREALSHVHQAMVDGIEVVGYLHWSALDNFEWGHWEPTFGLIGVDRETFERAPKPSLAFLGNLARANRIQVRGDDYRT